MAALKLDERGILVTCSNCGQTNRLQFARLGDSVRCGKCKQPLSPPAVPLEVQSTADFDRLVSQASIPVVVDFWAEWCGPCKRLGPTVDALATDYAGKVTVGKLNVDENPNVSFKFQIRGIPTLLLFKGGQVVENIVGVAGKDELKQVIDKHI